MDGLLSRSIDRLLRLAVDLRATVFPLPLPLRPEGDDALFSMSALSIFSLLRSKSMRRFMTLEASRNESRLASRGDVERKAVDPIQRTKAQARPMAVPSARAAPQKTL